MFTPEKESVASRNMKINAIKAVEGCLGDITYGFHVKYSVQWLMRLVEFYENLGKLPESFSKMDR